MTQVPEADLPRDGLGRLQVRAEDRVLEIAMPHVRTGVHVNGGHRLRLVDDQVAPGFQGNLALQRPPDLVLHAVEVEDRPLRLVELHLGLHLWDEAGREPLHPLVHVPAVDPDALDVRRQQVPEEPHRQGQILVDERPRLAVQPVAGYRFP